MLISRTILRTPRWAATCITLTMFFPSPFRVFAGEHWTLTVGTPGVWLVGAIFMGVWWFALYRAASLAAAQTIGHNGRDGRWFAPGLIAFIPIVALAHVLYAWEGTPPGWLLATMSGLIAVIALSMLVAAWLTARALVRYETRRIGTTPSSIFPTFLALMYLPIGVWFLYSRIPSREAS